jgi:hypothetical protein
MLTNSRDLGVLVERPAVEVVVKPYDRWLAKRGLTLDDISGLRMELMRRWPLAFNRLNRRPLKIGIHRDILAEIECDPFALNLVLRRWCGHTHYLSAVALGRCRHDLQGREVADLSPEEREAAQVRWQRWAAQIRRHDPESGERPMPTLTGRSIKVVIPLDPVEIATLAAAETQRTTLRIRVFDRAMTADIASKSVRKVHAMIRDVGTEGVAVIVQGKLGPNDEILEAGLMAQVKAPKPLQTAAAA